MCPINQTQLNEEFHNAPVQFNFKALSSIQIIVNMATGAIQKRGFDSFKGDLLPSTLILF